MKARFQELKTRRAVRTYIAAISSFVERACVTAIDLIMFGELRQACPVQQQDVQCLAVVCGKLLKFLGRLLGRNRHRCGRNTDTPHISWTHYQILLSVEQSMHLLAPLTVKYAVRRSKKTP